MITGAHAIIYSTAPELDRAFLRDVLRLPNVDVGHGWLVFALPPAEVAVHPADANGTHELYLICEDIAEFRRQMRKAGVGTEEPVQQRWGAVTRLSLPGGGKLAVYQPLHERPAWGTTSPPSRPTSKRRPPN